MKKKFVLFVLMLTVTAGLFSCNNSNTPKTQPLSSSPKPKNALEAALDNAITDTSSKIKVIIVSPTTGKVTTMSGDQLKKMLDEWKTNTSANFAKGKQYYNEKMATVYWVKQRNTKPMFSYFPDKWIGIGYHAYGFKGTKHGNMVYTICEKDSIGEICFAADDVTTNVTETENWRNSATEVYANLTAGIAQGCAMEEDDAVFQKQVLPQILSEMSKMKLKTSGKLTPTEIVSILQKYTENKKPIKVSRT